MGLSVDERVQLRDFLIDRFNLAEMKDLLFDLGLSYDDLPHETRPELATETIAYCERRDLLGCLLSRVAVLRRDERLAMWIAATPPCQGEREKVQIILRGSMLSVQPEQFRQVIAQCFTGLSPDEVTLIGVASDAQGARALVSVPAAHSPSTQAVSDAPPAITSPFTTLDTLDQRTWQVGYAEGAWSPQAQPTASPTPVTPQPPKSRPLAVPQTLLTVAKLAAAVALVLVASVVILSAFNRSGPLLPSTPTKPSIVTPVPGTPVPVTPTPIGPPPVTPAPIGPVLTVAALLVALIVMWWLVGGVGFLARDKRRQPRPSQPTATQTAATLRPGMTWEQARAAVAAGTDDAASTTATQEQ